MLELTTFITYINTNYSIEVRCKYQGSRSSRRRGRLSAMCVYKKQLTISRNGNLLRSNKSPHGHENINQKAY